MVMRMGFGRKGTYDRERNLTYSDQGTYGTSGFMTDAEMREVLELVPDIAGNRGVILGKLYGKAVCLPEKTRMNRNVAVFGASGSMKSRAYARNVVFQCVKRGESLIITDPKSELYADIKAENDKEREKARPLYDRFCEFAEKIEDRLEESEVITLYEFLD